MGNKYRAYIKWAKIILEVEIIDFKRKRVYCKTEMNKPNPCDFYNFDDIILLQYTGLKDKNGVDIYEGDIVSFDNNGFNDRGVVIYDSPCFIVEGFFLIDSSIEVVGNTYENPDLLKG